MKNSKERKDAYQIITDRMIEQLEKGVCPWLKPWHGGIKAHNRISNKPYSFMNQMLLSHSGEYASFKQWKDLGGKVKKGAKAEYLLQWYLRPIKCTDQKENPETGEIEEVETEKDVLRPRLTPVFHISQVEGVEPKVDGKIPNFLSDADRIDHAEKVIKDYCKREHISIIEEYGDRACYSPAMDSVTLPDLAQFKSANEYYSTTFHELGHSTGHKSRLDRLRSTHFGSQTYAKEELIAEMTSCYILDACGLNSDTTERNSAAYLDSWLSVLTKDKKFIVNAAAAAEKACELILNEQ